MENPIYFSYEKINIIEIFKGILNWKFSKRVPNPFLLTL